MVIWITGLSGVGKTTVAWTLQRLFQQRGRTAVVLDGDAVRQAVGDARCGHDRDSRLVNAYRISRLAGLLAGQGIEVIVATMSLFHEIHRWNRENLPDYFEVFLRASLDTVRRRDPKGLYSRAENGLETNIVGVHLEVEEPLGADMVLDNDDDVQDVGPLIEKLFAAITESCGDRHQQSQPPEDG